MYGLKTEGHFDSAHFLTNYNGKCENLHGHQWRVVAYLEVDELRSEGTMKDMVVDFAVFKHALKAEVDALDHAFLVEEGSLADETVACLKNEGFKLIFLPFRTTAENLARYFFEKLAAQNLPISQIDVYETPTNMATYRR